MAFLRIFDTDPDAKPKPKPSYNNEFAFRFRSGKMNGRKPMSLDAWRVTTGEKEVAESIAQLMGGSVNEWETSKDDFLEVLTGKDSVEVVISGVKAIKSTLVLWGQRGPIHECDGVTSLLSDDFGQPCGCPSLLADRKALAKAGRGPAPNTKVEFRLAEDYDLGLGQFVSTSWELVKVLHEIANDLDEVGDEALCELSLELVEYDHSTYGRVSYRKPVIKVIKAWSEAIAE